MELTYYDTRQQDEALIERRQEAADRVQGKIPSTPSSTGLSGPRQLKDVKRRPLPSGPPGAPARPAVPEQVHSAPPLQQPAPSRPVIPEHLNSVSSAPEPMPQVTRHSEPAYDASAYRAPSPVPPPSRGGYDGADNYPQEWDNSTVAPLRRQNTHESPYASQEVVEPQYDSRPQQPRSQSDYEQPPSRDYRLAREHSYELDVRGAPYHPGHQDSYAQIEQPRYNPDPISYGAPHAHELPPSDYMMNSHSEPMDDPRYHLHSVRPLQITARPHDWHPEYAGMQPRVEDEDDDGLPPPPPVHRSRTAHSQVPTPKTSPNPYAPYTRQSASRSPVAHAPSSISTPTHRGRYQEPPSTGNSPAMPPSLVAGYETEDSSERAAFERSVRRRSPHPHWDDEMMLSEPPAPASQPAPAHYDAPIYPLRTSPRPIEQRPTSSRGVSPDSRAVTRKSVSPRPSTSDGRGGSAIPFSPDSYISLNPNASRPSSRDPSPAYDSPSQARDAAVRAKGEPKRDADQPIIGDDGREIDPSDHLPTDTWAPEPERKNRKPEVIIRFKHSPRPTSRGNDSSSARPTPPRVGFRTETTTYPADRQIQYTPTHGHASPGAVVRTPPRQDYSRERSDSYQSRGYSTPTSVDRPRSSRGSVSPSPSARSPLYDYNSGPPIPNKVPISGGNPSYPVMSGNPSGGRMDALSRELSTIDIGSPSCSPGRGAMRKYVPRASASMGYAS